MQASEQAAGQLTEVPTEPQSRMLILIRHAKSAWGLDLADHDRPLSTRGRRDAAELGALLTTRKLAADLLICSTAVRAMQTWELASAAGAKADHRVEDPRVYEAVTDELIKVLQETPDEIRSVIMIGHGPAIPDLVETLAVRHDRRGDPLREAWRQMDAKYPTSGCAVINFDGRWAKLRPGRAELESFDVPRAGVGAKDAKKQKQLSDKKSDKKKASDKKASSSKKKGSKKK